jgi:hypothetical protein
VKKYRAVLGPLAVVLIFLAGTRWSPFEPHRPPADPSGAAVSTPSWDDADWRVVERLVREAQRAGLDAMPMGRLMATIGRELVGIPYAAGTLEVEGPERLVVNLRELDCVTFVENVYSLAVLVKTGASARLADRGGVEAEYERALRGLRYRNALIDGYPSRLHYFSEWIADGERKGLLTDVTRELGGVLDREPIDFMSTHRDAYRQLSDDEVLTAVRATEEELSARGRWYVPEARIAEIADGIKDGDIIAATSTVPGLDVAHTGLALWVDGTLRLLHAPLVGDSVEISELPLAERILGMGGQDGIIVARPTEPRVLGAGEAASGG